MGDTVTFEDVDRLEAVAGALDHYASLCKPRNGKRWKLEAQEIRRLAARMEAARLSRTKGAGLHSAHNEEKP